MEYDSIHNKLKDLLEKSGGKLKILEDQIDVNMQVDFFEMVNKLKGEDTVKLENAEILLNNEDYPDELKKELLIYLSNSKQVEHYRLIENYIDNSNGEIKKWATLAFQHARITLESELLDEQQVFISTGLGGKDESLRYFISLRIKSSDKFSDAQEKVIRNEFDYCLTKDNSEVESIEFDGKLCYLLALIPVKQSISDVIKNAINEVNQFGDFLKTDFLITNVKKLEKREIEKYFNKKENKNTDE